MISLRKKISTALVFLGGGILLCSCSHYYYAPNSNNTPLFREKDELSLNGNLFTGSNHSGGELQGAYAVGKHSAVMVNLMGASEADKESPNGNVENNSGSGFFAEGGAGLFFPIKDSKWVFESFGGLGFGSITNDYGQATSKTNYSRLFLQPDLGFRSRFFDFVISSRLSLTNVKIKSINNPSTLSSSELDEIVFVGRHKSSLMWEPGMSASLGFQPFKVKVFVCRSYNVNYPDFPQDEAIIGIGLHYLMKTGKKTRTAQQ